MLAFSCAAWYNYFMIFPEYISLGYCSNDHLAVVPFIPHDTKVKMIRHAILGGGPEAVWEEKYWIMLLNAGTSLPSVRHYIRMNPARKKTVPQHEPEIASILERAKSGAIPGSS